MKPYPLGDGEKLVKAARHAIELFLVSPHFKKSMVEASLSNFNQEQGVFVTIAHYPTKELRGCMGFPRPSKELKDLLIDAAVAAATKDRRFVPVSHMEFEHITVEVSLLSRPEQIKAKSQEGIKREIKIGKDGLIIDYGYHSGLFLPPVPIEQDWGKGEYLRNLCLKAGLSEETWKQPHVSLYKFTTQSFREKSPRGPIEEIL